MPIRCARPCLDQQLQVRLPHWVVEFAAELQALNNSLLNFFGKLLDVKVDNKVQYRVPVTVLVIITNFFEHCTGTVSQVIMIPVFEKKHLRCRYRYCIRYRYQLDGLLRQHTRPRTNFCACLISFTA